MADIHTPPDAAGVAGAFDDPLANWGNDDLLLKKQTRDFFARHYPNLLPIFDWPELRALFEQHNDAAGAAQASSRRFGMFALAAGFVSLAIAAASPAIALIPVAMRSWVEVIAGASSAFLAVLGVGLGYSVLWGGSKKAWLTHRFWTERLRQLHFQLLIGNFPLAERAAKGEIQAWVDFRARELDKFVHQYMAPVTDAFVRVMKDRAEDHAWLSPDWDAPPAAVQGSDHVTALMEALHQQRIGIQRRYTTLKLKAGWYSPASRARWIQGVSDILTLFVLAAAIVAGCTFAFGGGTLAIAATAFGGVCSMIVIALRVLNEGLQLDADSERYSWYLASVEALERRFTQGDPAQKIAALRSLEETAYREMRSFLQSTDRARFLM